jgi:hypothetical protein
MTAGGVESGEPRAYRRRVRSDGTPGSATQKRRSDVLYFVLSILSCSVLRHSSARRFEE